MSSTTTAGSRRSVDIGALLLEGRAFLALVAIFVIFSVLAPNAYPTVSNVLVMSSHVAIYALLAMGMLLVILNGGIDLSVGSTLGMAGMVAGFLMKGVDLSPFGIDSTLFPPVWVVALVSIGVGALIGLVNGVLVARFNVAPFVATLGTLYAVRGLASLMTNGLTYNDFGGDEALGNTGFDWLGFNRIATVPIGVVVMVVIALVLSGVLNRSVFGRWLYASGGNERAAELSGVPTRKVKIWVYVVSGITAAIAGLILTSQLTSAGPTAGTTYELTAIAAVVIGGAALSGGRGNIRGTLLGAFVIGFLSDGLVIVGVSVYWQTVFTGAVIVAAVLLNSVQYKGKRRARSGSGGSPGGGTSAPPPASPKSPTTAAA
ncbi:ABC transporter permease [Kineococcus esterisolvens]|uniref:ABC transporter permease n=1 Tax=unclassified Kineococcus TaxID=2621656 RepID=UPI003D7CB021